MVNGWGAGSALGTMAMSSKARATWLVGIDGPWHVPMARTPSRSSADTSRRNRASSTSWSHGLFHCWNTMNPPVHASGCSSDTQRVGAGTGVANASDAQ